MKVRIIAPNGTHGTRIYLDDVEVSGVLGYHLHAQVGDITRLELFVRPRSVEVEAEAEVIESARTWQSMTTSTLR